MTPVHIVLCTLGSVSGSSSPEYVTSAADSPAGTDRPRATAIVPPQVGRLAVAIPADFANLTPYTAGQSTADFVMEMGFDKLHAPSPYVAVSTPGTLVITSLDPHLSLRVVLHVGDGALPRWLSVLGRGGTAVNQSIVPGRGRESPLRHTRLTKLLRRIVEPFSRRYAWQASKRKKEGYAMIVMKLRKVTACEVHGRAIITLENVGERLRLTFYADLAEAQRLAQVIERGAGQPVYDFLQALLQALQATMTRVVLDEVAGERIGSFIHCWQAASDVVVPCYTSDALALALRANLPIYATAAALAHAERLASSPGTPAERGEVTQWLAQVKPEDFSSHLGVEDS